MCVATQKIETTKYTIRAKYIRPISENIGRILFLNFWSWGYTNVDPELQTDYNLYRHQLQNWQDSDRKLEEYLNCRAENNFSTCQNLVTFVVDGYRHFNLKWLDKIIVSHSGLQ